ncbi:hypothetical protein ACTQ6A_11605 [Lachnospiraceae bacterium LCP25S3_G4]
MEYTYCPKCGNKIEFMEEICPYCELDLDAYYARKAYQKKEDRPPSKIQKTKKISYGKKSKRRKRKKKASPIGKRGKSRSKKRKKGSGFKAITVLCIFIILIIFSVIGYQLYGEKIVDYVKYIKENYRIEKIESSKEQGVSENQSEQNSQDSKNEDDSSSDIKIPTESDGNDEIISEDDTTVSP